MLRPTHALPARPLFLSHAGDGHSALGQITKMKHFLLTFFFFYPPPGATPACTRAPPTAARKSAATPTSCAPRRSSSEDVFCSLPAGGGGGAAATFQLPPQKKTLCFPFLFLLCVRKEACARATSGSLCVCKRFACPPPFRVFFRIMTSVVCVSIVFTKPSFLSFSRSLSAQSSTN